jgi:hypothetical protein
MYYLISIILQKNHKSLRNYKDAFKGPHTFHNIFIYLYYLGANILILFIEFFILLNYKRLLTTLIRLYVGIKIN